MSERLEDRLLDAFLAREPASDADRAEAERDPALRALVRDLERLDAGLAACEAPDLPPMLPPRSLALARSELRAAPRGAVALELLRLAAAAALPFVLVLLLHTTLVLHAPALLGAWLPDFVPAALTTWLPIAYALGAAGWVALLIGSLPVLAHRTAARRVREVPA